MRAREHGVFIVWGGGWERVGAAVGFALRGLGWGMGV